MGKVFEIAVIPGDGIGPEVVAEAVKVLNFVTNGGENEVNLTNYKLGAEHWLETGETLPEETLENLKKHDAILFGAVGAAPGDTRIPSGLIEREMLLKLRFSLDHYVNLRPSKLYPGIESPLANPGNIDFIVVREGTEGPYVGNGGSVRTGTAHEIATEVSVNTAFGVERVVRDAFARASRRERRHVTLVHKHNVLVHAGHLWRRTVEAVSKEFPEVTHDYLHVDAATIFLTTDPARFDVIVTDNLFGDILTDQAGAITGGIGLSASGNINMSRTYPSMFEPVHGSAPDIAGQQKADPTAAILSVALMLDHLGLTDESKAVEQAVEKEITSRQELTDRRTTSEIGDAIVALLA
ncbi:3-isopropylmalate dehydrogenase [Glutamicibacter soli]